MTFGAYHRGHQPFLRDNTHERENKILELRINNESLRKENYAKDREIRRLNKDIQQYELTLTNLRTEMTQGQGTCSPPEVIKKDAEVMAGMCCTGTECGDLEPVKDVGELLREETSKYRERIHKMELSLKSSGVKVRAVHKINLGLIEELGTLRRLCVAVDLERRDARLRLDLEGQIVKQMLKQLQQAKAKKPCQVATSTPEGSLEALHDSDLSIIPNQPPSPIIVSDSSTTDLDLILETCTSHQQLCSRDCDVHEQPTMRLENSNDSLTSQHQSTQRNKNLESPDDHDRSGNKSETSDRKRNKSITSDQNQTAQYTQKNKKNMDQILEQIASDKIRHNLESLDNDDGFSNTVETSERNNRGSITSDQSQTAQYQTTQRNKKNLDQILGQLASNKVRRNMESIEDVSDNKSDTSKEHANKSKPSDRKRNKSTTSENQPGFCEKKTSGDTLKQSVISQVESWLETSDIDISVNTNKTCLCWKNNVQTQIPHRVHKNDCCHVYQEELSSLQLQLSDCSSADAKEGEKETSLQSQICNCGSAKDSAGVKEREGRPSQICDCSNADAKERYKETSLQSQICNCGSAKDSAGFKEREGRPTQMCDCSSDEAKEEKKGTLLRCQICDCKTVNDSVGGQKREGRPSQKCDCNSYDAKEGKKETLLRCQICDSKTAKDTVGVQKLEGPHKIAKVEEQSFAKDAKLKLKQCRCTKLECMKNVETGDKNDEKADAKTPVKKDSGGGSSCAGVCEQYYHNKLMATLKILENKEETIRVQGSSLGVAEARIAALTERACALRCELDQKARELNQLRKFAESCRVEKADISITAEMQEVETQKNIVNTLQDNLSVIGEMYRECFFETAKQEELIDMLRKSYLDVRLMDKDKADKINRLQSVISTQKWSIEQCQDVVIEVENLKSEISNFLNSSNNDSGMWERGSEAPDVGEELGDILEQLRQLQDMLTGMWERGSGAPDVGEELGDILEQLRQLQDMLTGDCICGLQDENIALKKKNEHLEMQIDKLRHRVSELEGIVSSSHSLGQQYQKQIEEKEQEFFEVRQRLVEFESANQERGATCETLTRQLQQSQVLLDDKIAELAEAQRARASQEAAVLALKRELEQADSVIKEGLRKLVEASQWRAQFEESQARAEELERRLQAICVRCRDLETCCSEKERSASVLQGQLEEAHARGAALCDESRRVTACVRHWMRRQRALAREQQEKIKTQESMLSELQRCVEAKQNHSVRTSTSEIEPCCSNSPRLHVCASETYSLCSRTHQTVGGSETAFSRCGGVPNCESERPSCSQCASNRQIRRERSSESEMASCSSAPVPPRRRKKLPPCDDSSCPWSPGAPSIRFASLPRHMSPTEEIVERVEHLHAALEATQRRWGRPRR